MDIENKLYKFYLITFLIIFSVLPFAAVPPWFHPETWGKFILFRVILSILLFIFIKQVLYKEIDFSYLIEKIKSVSWLFGLLLLLAGLYFLSAVFSPEPSFSFWGSPMRGGGAVNMIFMIIFPLILFLIVRPKDWQKIWDFSFIGGLVVSFIGIFQKFEWFGEYIIGYYGRVVSTMGGPSFLALYLLLLLPIALCFGVKYLKNKSKKSVFYFFCALMFSIVLILAATRAAFLGLFVAFLYFIFFYPTRQFSRKYRIVLLAGKTSAIVLIIAGFFIAHWIVNNPDTYRKVEQNKILGVAFERIEPLVKDFSIYKIVPESRVSSWRIGLKSIKDHPILGYGPENYSIPYDKYFDQTLPGFSATDAGGGTNWWDRAHNFVIEIAVTVGLPALIVYFLIAGILFFWLQRLKKTQSIIICHGIQATFIAYFTALLFGFDCFSSYLIFFLFVAYILSSISQFKGQTAIKEARWEKTGQSLFLISEKYKGTILTVLFIAIIIFIWLVNLKPLGVNAEINYSDYYIGLQPPEVQKAIDKMEKAVESPGILRNYIELKYADNIGKILPFYPEQRVNFAKKAIDLLGKAKDSRKTYTRTWYTYGAYINIFIESYKKIDPVLKKQLLQEADSAFKKAYELSPGRQRTLISWIRADILREDYEQAKKRSQQCIDLDSTFADCWWALGISEIYLSDMKEATLNMQKAVEKGYDNQSRDTMIQLLNAYIKYFDASNNKRDVSVYPKLAEVYEKLIFYEPGNFQYYASAAFVYNELKEYDKARDRAIFTYALSPESLVNIESFIKHMPYDGGYYKNKLEYYKEQLEIFGNSDPKSANIPRYHLAIAFIYRLMGNYQEAKKEANLVIDNWPTLESYMTEFLKTLP